VPYRPICVRRAFGDAGRAFGKADRQLLERCISELESTLSSNDERTYDTLLPLYDRLDALNADAEADIHAEDKEPEVAQRVDHEHVSAGAKGVDYVRLVHDFGSSLLQPADLDKIAQLSSEPPHVFLRRGLFFSHRDLDDLLDAHARGEPFYIFTGRGPSASMHLGHLIPFQFAAYLQRVFNAPVVIQLSDDEKFFFKGLSLEQAATYADENIRDIIACGFDPQRTFIFTDTQAIGALYPMICQLQRKLTISQVASTFGVRVASDGGEATDCLGKLMYPSVQMAPAFAAGLPPELFGHAKRAPRCLVPMGIDQDPYFRVVRDVASSLGHPKPAVIHNKFLPALGGMHTKMSSTGQAGAASTPINLTDTPKDVKKKLGRAFTGARGDGSLEALRRLGVDLSIDVPIKYLQYFEPDDALLSRVEAEYATGARTSGEVKGMAAEAIIKVLGAHQEARARVTDEDVARFKAVRPLL